MTEEKFARLMLTTKYNIRGVRYVTPKAKASHLYEASNAGSLNLNATLHTGKPCFLNIFLNKPSCLNRKYYQEKTCTFSRTQGQTNLTVM